MSHADRVRVFGREKYVLPARARGESRFSIRAGDVVNEMKLTGRTPTVCSALKTHQFLKENGLRLIEVSGPGSGQSTTVVYTYEFVGQQPDERQRRREAFNKLRGLGKDVYASFGGGEAYLRAERENFYAPGQDPLDPK
jgi:hypothetical protein